MGEVEKSNRKRQRKNNIQYAVLKTVQVAGVVTVAAMAPKVLELLKYTKGHPSSHKQRITRSLDLLEQKGLVRIDKQDGIQVTSQGQRLLEQIDAKGQLPTRPRKWDQQWRIVIFDVPEKRRVARNRLRDMLRRIGFYQLQGSVWVYPYDAEDLVTLIKSEYKLGTEVIYLVTGYLEGDAFLRKHFKVT